MSAEQEAAFILPPLLNIAASGSIQARITQGVIATSTSSARTDLGSISALHRGHFITIMNDGASGEDVYIALNTADAGAIDETATGFGVTVCFPIKAGESLPFKIPANDSGAAYQWLIHKAKSGTPKLRIYVSSLAPGEDTRALQASP